MAQLAFVVLGPAELLVDGKRVALPGPRARAILALLALRAGQRVSMDRLIDALWPQGPPAYARNQLQGYVSKLRRLLPAGVLSTLPSGGYRLEADPESVDAHRFERLARTGEQALADGRLDDAAHTLEAALALWPGPTTTDADWSLAPAERPRLHELHRCALEYRIDVDLRRQRFGDVIGRLQDLVAAHPLHEGFRLRLMRALHGSGRHAEALAAYRDAHRVFTDELGIEPSTELKSLERAILQGEPAVIASASCLLPPAVSGFVGRHEEMARARAALEAERFLLLTGAGGVGKSTMATRLAHAVRPRYPDGQLFIDLHGMGPRPRPPHESLGLLLRGMGVPGAAVPDDPTERQMAYRSLVADRAVLIVLDDAAGEQQVRPLLPGTGRSAVVITSRSRLAGLDDTLRVPLGVLDRGESLQLMSEIAGAQRVDAEPSAADTIARLCGDHPLAVRIAAARIAARPHLRLAWLADELSDEHGRLDALCAGDLEVRATLAVGYDGLDPLARKALRLLSRVEAPDFPAWMVACLLDATVTDAERCLEALVEAWLVEPVESAENARLPRYHMHDLIRLFAKERADAEEAEPDGNAALDRVFGGYLAVAERADDALAAGILKVDRLDANRHPLPDGYTKALLADPSGWLMGELPTLVALVAQAASVKAAEVACGLAAAMAKFMETRNLYDEWAYTHTRALDAALAAGAQRAALAIMRNLGELHAIRDEYDEAVRRYHQTLAIAHALDDRPYQAAALAGLGYVHRLLGSYPESIAHFTDAAQVARRIGNRRAEIYSEHGLGTVWFEQGRLEQARERFAGCLRGSRQAGFRAGEAQALRGLGLVHLTQGDTGSAQRCLRRALAISTELGDRLVAAYSEQLLAEALIQSGRVEQGLALLDRADEVFASFGNRFGQAMAMLSRARAHRACGQRDEARKLAERARATWRQLRIHYWPMQAQLLLDSVHD
ncbi:AfsR/SARP family transcriptional regulator [Allorhizocola rhizosphaerae]|uniref:AfsR/SARP family transcriptional regulator n=1 Tax=Allorhizocola rhizosphaerae TaxID=1872709 RepID=UPI000E3D9969|nr:BTAD domain-containing putative transcriptional regulator [Allorhizocola rhizosphaerae]